MVKLMLHTQVDATDHLAIHLTHQTQIVVIGALLLID